MGGVAEPVVPKGRSLLAVTAAQLPAYAQAHPAKIHRRGVKRLLSLVSRSYGPFFDITKAKGSQASGWSRPERIAPAIASRSPGEEPTGGSFGSEFNL